MTDHYCSNNISQGIVIHDIKISLKLIGMLFYLKSISHINTVETEINK
jgi:hypothetical protein